MSAYLPSTRLPASLFFFMFCGSSVIILRQLSDYFAAAQ
jgi:hypothetical protein